MITGGHQAKRAIALLADPLSGFDGVATGVVSLVTEGHAALELLRRILHDGQQLPHIDTVINT